MMSGLKFTLSDVTSFLADNLSGFGITYSALNLLLWAELEALSRNQAKLDVLRKSKISF